MGCSDPAQATGYNAPVFADLHLHSTFSDGTLSPVELAQLCRARGIEAISVTDHDSWDQNIALAAATAGAERPQLTIA